MEEVVHNEIRLPLTATKNFEGQKGRNPKYEASRSYFRVERISDTLLYSFFRKNLLIVTG